MLRAADEDPSGLSPAARSASAALPALARAAFGALVIRARSSYKNEIAALYPPLALAPLESRESSPAAKLTALRLIRALCGDPQVLVDIFVNYDCDADAPNLYERTVAALAGATVAGSGDAQQVRNGAVQCVLAVVRSLRTLSLIHI